jgi:hypothetical protein
MTRRYRRWPSYRAWLLSHFVTQHVLTSLWDVTPRTVVIGALAKTMGDLMGKAMGHPTSSRLTPPAP